MRERPILFNDAMARAILEGRKTQTRRPVKPQPDDDGLAVDALPREYGIAWRDSSYVEHRCPFGRPGDRLWVREAWAPTGLFWASRPRDTRACGQFRYRATDESPGVTGASWRSSIHMPRWASRLTLRVTDVRVERVQEISDSDIAAEGLPEGAWYWVSGGPRKWFSCAWSSIYSDELSWSANPWVWAVSFEVVK